MTTHGTPEVFPELDLDLLVGLTVPEATAIAQAAGVEMIRPIERVDGQMVEAIDMMRAPRRLKLWHQDGQVILANFDWRSTFKRAPTGLKVALVAPPHPPLRRGVTARTSLMLAAGESPKVVAEILGHSSPTITQNVYQHLMPGMAEGAAQRLTELLSESG